MLLRSCIRSSGRGSPGRVKRHLSVPCFGGCPITLLNVAPICPTFWRCSSLCQRPTRLPLNWRTSHTWGTSHNLEMSHHFVNVPPAFPRIGECPILGEHPIIWVNCLQVEAAPCGWDSARRSPVADLVDHRKRKGASPTSARGPPERHPRQPTPPQ